MKFSWKVFCSVTAILCVSFSLGGALLISVWFQSALSREIQFAQEENRLLRFSLQTAVSALPVYPESDVKQLVSDVIQSILPPAQQSTSPVRVTDSQGQILYDGRLSAVPTLPQLLQDEDGGYLIIEEEGRFLIRYISTGRLYGQDIFVESQRDASAVFQQRQDQFSLYARLTVVMLLLGGGAALLLARWLTRPILRLSAATRQMAQGDYAVRAPASGRDEAGALARDFNAMAASLELKLSQLQQAIQRQEEFSGSFAHEVKTPLTSIIGYADMLRSRRLDEEKSFLSANYIYTEGKRLEAMSFRLLEIIVTKRSQIQPRMIEAAYLFQYLQDMYANDRTMTFLFQCGDGKVWADPDLIRSVLMNLIDNACKASEPGSAVWISGQRLEGGYRFFVEDQGIGIPREEQDKITKAFYMVDKSRSRSRNGAGLGLALCAEILALHDSRLEIQSEVGQGTRMSFWLPDPKKDGL